MLRDILRDAQNANDFVKKNTIASLINKIEWLISEKLRYDPKHNTIDLNQVIEILKGMK